MLKVKFFSGRKGFEGFVSPQDLPGFLRGATVVPQRPWVPKEGVIYEALLGREICAGGRRPPIHLVAAVNAVRDEAASEKEAAEKVAAEKAAAEKAAAEKAVEAAIQEANKLQVAEIASKIKEMGGLDAAPRFSLLFRVETGMLRAEGWTIREKDIVLLSALRDRWVELCCVLQRASDAADEVKARYAERLTVAEKQLEALRAEEAKTLVIAGVEVTSDFTARKLVTRSRRVCYGASPDERQGPIEMMVTSPELEQVPIEGELLEAAKAAFQQSEGLSSRTGKAYTELEWLRESQRYETGVAWKSVVHESGIALLANRLGEVNPHYFN